LFILILPQRLISAKYNSNPKRPCRVVLPRSQRLKLAMAGGHAGGQAD